MSKYVVVLDYIEGEFTSFFLHFTQALTPRDRVHDFGMFCHWGITIFGDTEGKVRGKKTIYHQDLGALE